MWHLPDCLAVFPIFLQVSLEKFLFAGVHCAFAVFISRYLLSTCLCARHYGIHWDHRNTNPTQGNYYPAGEQMDIRHLITHSCFNGQTKRSIVQGTWRPQLIGGLRKASLRKRLSLNPKGRACALTKCQAWACSEGWCTLSPRSLLHLRIWKASVAGDVSAVESHPRG